MKEIALSFDDVMIVPKYSEIDSRDNVDISTVLYTNDPQTQLKLQIPIVSSPMDTVSGPEMVYRLFLEGGLGILHRYNSVKEQEQDAIQAKCLYQNSSIDKNNKFLFGAAIGVTGDYLERAQMLVTQGVSCLCIDVAHGHHIKVVKALENLWKDIDLSKIHIMAGNVGPSYGFKYLASTKLVNSVRCGISGGSICSTYLATGVGFPTFQSVADAESMRNFDIKLVNIGICADGGLRTPGDIVKALAAGANFVMLGSMLAGTKPTPGARILDKDGRECKQYRGGASFESQKARGIEKPRVEGVSALIPYKGKLENIIDPIRDGIASGCSYVGASNLDDLVRKTQFITISQNGHIAGTPHILRGR